MFPVSLYHVNPMSLPSPDLLFMAAQTNAELLSRTHTLLSRARRQRALRGGSLLVTVLGDSIVPRGGVIALGSLIRLAAPFGLTERLVRTSIGRLAHEQWVHGQRSGRSSFYSLTGEGKARFAEATQRIYGPGSAGTAAWNGEWTLIIVPPTLRKLRESVRQELTWLGFGQLTSGVFAHPTHREDVIRARLAELGASTGLIVMQKALAAQTKDTQLVDMGWDLGELARRYRRFIEMFAPVNDALSAPARAQLGETAFVLRTLLVHEYRRIHLRDPQLPASLLPRNWVGTNAHDLCRSLYAKVFVASESHLTTTVQTLAGALPPPVPEVFARFGGLPGC
jgi:phenylacetic acid degradation operon negative regulatory protein